MHEQGVKLSVWNSKIGKMKHRPEMAIAIYPPYRAGNPLFECPRFC
jgi:hypothetical protein